MAGTIHQAMAYLGLTTEQTEPQEVRYRESYSTNDREELMDYDEDYYYDDEPVAETSYSSPEIAAVRADIMEEETISEPQPENYSSYETETVAPVKPTHQVAAPTQASYRQSDSAVSQNNNNESEDSLRQITTIHPRSYNDAKIIGESFRENIPVIMNVTDMGEAEAKRLVDFSAGLAFALHGSIERVTDKVFLLTPTNLEVLAPEGVETPIALDVDHQGLFNQG